MPDPTTSDPAPEPEPSRGDSSPDSPAAQPASPEDQDAATVSSAAVDFSLQTADTQPPAAGWLDTKLLEALKLSGVRTGQLDVTLIDDAEMCRLHAEYCEDPTTTDVLTFDLKAPGAPADHVEGDLALCRDEAQRQATARGHDARTELLLYAVHGLMHLLGEDDHDDADYQRMHAREDALLTQMGLGPVFHGRAASETA